MKTLKKFILSSVCAALALTTLQAQDANAGGAGKIKVRIKDVARLSGTESYTLVGYGLVVGLNGTGDSDKSLVQRTITNMVQNFNVIVSEADVKAQNTACVMVTATIKGASHKGDMVQANVSSIGDAKSLLGGELLLTPILGADGETWGIAQGSVTTGGFSFGSTGEGGNQVTKNHPTAGMLTNGVKLLRDVGTGIKNQDVITYYLQDPDYTSAVNLADTINKKYFGSSIALDAATVKVRVPSEFKDEARITSFISEVEQLYFTNDSNARVVFNEKTGTIVIGADVRISAAAVCHGNLTVDIKNTVGVSQPNAFSETGKTEKINDQTTGAKEEKVPVIPIKQQTTVGDLAAMLNSLHVSPRDIMIVFHVLKAAGALHAELESM